MSNSELVHITTIQQIMLGLNEIILRIDTMVMQISKGLLCLICTVDCRARYNLLTPWSWESLRGH